MPVLFFTWVHYRLRDSLSGKNLVSNYTKHAFRQENRAYMSGKASTYFWVYSVSNRRVMSVHCHKDILNSLEINQKDICALYKKILKNYTGQSTN